ncbi:hypothetical protein B9Z55_015002 [Caenorhabditis nigoni]|uniref:Uncharacterized protein n=1 Tax=Caenorhabditis nigoni TaxID=1611254 RepID=A0A2G5U8Q5_9PELO|nr:hypothetical protein B9Z55_015002 [Caenorhabditis nigoni]
MKVSEFNHGTSYNGILPTRPDMSEDKVLIRRPQTADRPGADRQSTEETDRSARSAWSAKLPDRTEALLPCIQYLQIGRLPADPEPTELTDRSARSARSATSAVGRLKMPPKMSFSRKLKMYSILFFVLFILFLITTIIVSVILGINIKAEQDLEDQLEKCIEMRDQFFFKSNDHSNSHS